MKVMTQDKVRIIDFRMPCTEGYFIRDSNMKYNLSKIMLKAWKVYRKTKNISFAEQEGEKNGI